MILTIEAYDGGITVRAVEDGKKRGGFRMDIGEELDSAAEKFSDLRGAEGAILAAETPELAETLAERIARAAGLAVRAVTPGMAQELSPEDETDGVLLAAALGARGRYRLPCVLIRTGAETAVCALDDRGKYPGALKCPGIPQGTALAAPERLFSFHEAERHANGLVFGMAAMLDGLITRAETELRQQATAVLFGRGARDVLPHCHHQNAIVDDELVMRGLWRLWQEAQ